MASPITWRTINAPNLGDPSQSLRASQLSFTSAFDGINKVLDQREQTQVDNFGKMKEYNTDQFLNKLAEFQTPEEAQAALASGELAALRQQYGAQVDGKAVRDAQSSLVQNLQSKALANQTYTDTQTEVAERDVVGRAEQLINAGDFAGARDLINGSNLRESTKARLFGTAKTNERDDARWGMDLLRVQQGNEAHESALLTDAADRNYKVAQTGAANRSNRGGDGSGLAGLSALTNLITRVGENQQAPLQAVISNSPFSGDLAVSEKGRDAISSTLEQTGISNWNMATNKENFLDNVLKKVSTGDDPLVTPDGKSIWITAPDGSATKVPFTNSLFLRAIRNDNGALTDPSVGDVVKNLRQLASQPGFLEEAAAYESAKGQLANSQQGVAAALANITTNALGGGSTRPK